MTEEKCEIVMHCKFCGKPTKQRFIGENIKDTFTITFYCTECGSYHTFEFFGSQFEQPAELG